MMGVAGPAGDPSYPPHQPNMPPVPLGRTGTRYAQAMNKLGWHWWPSDIAMATTEYDGRAKCINLGHCTPGCAQGAKASVDITYWPHALRARVELRTRCRVREIATNEHGMASGVVYYDPNGEERFQPAEVVILAANGVGTPAAAAELGLVALSQRPGQLLRPGRQEPDAAPLAAGVRLCRRRGGRRPRAARR